ncbi:MAG: hypothetical protein ABR595_00015 [Psychroflexus sp.]
MSKVTLIKEIAENLVSNNKTMSYDQLAIHLNDIGCKTSFGTKYTGNRGVARLISSVYKKVKSRDQKAAEKIAKAFTNINGKYPWDK